MADPLVEPFDVQTVLIRPLTSDETNVIGGLCEQVSSKLRGLVGNIDQRIQAGSIDLDVVSAMLAGVVARFLNNPTEASSRSRGAGPFTEAASWSNDRTTGLVITDEDLKQLSPATGGFVMPGTIRTGSPFVSRALDCEA